MVSCDRVNPLYINEIERIHTFRRNREAIPHEGDLLYSSRFSKNTLGGPAG